MAGSGDHGGGASVIRPDEIGAGCAGAGLILVSKKGCTIKPESGLHFCDPFDALPKSERLQPGHVRHFQLHTA